MEPHDRVSIVKVYGRFAVGTIQRSGESIVIDQDSLSTSLHHPVRFALSPPPMPNLAKLFANGDVVSCAVESCDAKNRFYKLYKWKAAPYSVVITRRCIANKDKWIDVYGKIVEISSDNGIILYDEKKIRFNKDHVFPYEVSNLTDGLDEFKIDDRVHVILHKEISADDNITYEALSVEFEDRDKPVSVPSPITSKGTEDSSIESRSVKDVMDSIDQQQPSPPSVTDGEHRRSIPRDVQSSVHVVDRRSAEHRRKSKSPSAARRGEQQRRRRDSRSRSPLDRNRRQVRRSRSPVDRNGRRQARSPIHHRDRRRSQSGSSSAHRRQDHQHRQSTRDRSPPASQRPPFVDGSKVEPFDPDKYYRSAPKIKGFGSIVYRGPKCSLIDDLDKPRRRIFFYNDKAEDPGSLRKSQCVYFEAERTMGRSNLGAYYEANVISILRPEEAERVQEVARYRSKEIHFAEELEAAEHREIDQRNRRRASPPSDGRRRRRSPSKPVVKARRSPEPSRAVVGNRRDQSERSTSSGRRESRSIGKRGSSSATSGGHGSRRDQPTSTDQKGKSSTTVVADHQRDENSIDQEEAGQDGETARHIVDRQPFGDNIENNDEIILADDPKDEDDDWPKLGEEDIDENDFLKVVDTSWADVDDVNESKMDAS